MDVITTKSGPFAFGGVKVRRVREGDCYAGVNGKQLFAAGWAKPTRGTPGALEAEKEAAEKEAAEKEAAEKEAAEKKLLADAQRLAGGDNPPPKAKAKPKPKTNRGKKI